MFKKKNKEQNENHARDKVAGKIATFFMKVQTKFSNFMNKKVSHLSLTKMKILLTLFCLSWGGLSIYFIVNAVFDSKQISIKIDRINIPIPIERPDDRLSEDHVDEETFLQIQDYKKYMDSTHQPIRPGLLDSMNVLEQIYLSQQKK